MEPSEVKSLSKAISESYLRKDFTTSRSLISQLLTAVENDKKKWFYGNTKHFSNIFLGLMALDEGKIQKAKGYLILSGKVKTSPQLRSFGPNMLLAKRLLEIKESEAVLEYLKMIKKIWFIFFSYPKIKRWKKDILKGLIPDFGPNLLYLLATKDYNDFKANYLT